jgi:CelD/BcsL family acetyltransferase involved in cellulose biosynthesis
VQCIRDHWGFTLLRPHWNDLLRASAADNPFLTWEWLHTWWTQLGATRGLRLVVIRSGREIVAIAPFRLVNGALPCFSRLEFLGTGHAGSDYLDVIARRGYETVAAAALARHLASARLALHLRHVGHDATVALVARQLEQAGWTCTTSADGTCPVIPLDGHTWDSYLSTLGSSHRANVRRRLRALEQQFDVRFERASTESERRELLQRLVDFHSRRWSGRGGSTAFLTPAVRAFQDEVTRRAFARGGLRMYALRLDGALAGVMYGFSHGARFYFYQHGFDERFKDRSVGLVLMALTIRAALDEGAREFDMLWGVEPYKFLWARDRRPLQRLDLFPVHIGGAIHRRAITARRGVRTLARRVLSLGAHLWS